MKFEITHKEGFEIFSLKSGLTVQAVIFFRKKFETLFSEKKLFIALDFNNAASVDSSGLGLIVNVHKNLEKNDGYLALFNLSSEIKNLIQEAGVQNILNLFETEKSFLDQVRL